MSASSQLAIPVKPSFEDELERVMGMDLVQAVSDSLQDEHTAQLLLMEKASYEGLCEGAKQEYKQSDFAEEMIDIPLPAYYYWIQREGRDVWLDPFFVAWFLKENPQCRRKMTTGNTVITNPGLPAQASNHLYLPDGRVHNVPVDVKGVAA